MNTRLPLLLVVTILVTAGGAVAEWTKQSAIPTDRYLNGVSFTSPTHLFVCGDDRHLMESTDGGVTWSMVMASDFSADPFYKVHFSDELHGYVTGNNNDAWRTTDGGSTWVQMTTVPGGSWSQIDFITSTEGFVGANGALAYTSNGGINWIVKSGYPTCPVIFGMDFRDAQTGLAGGIIAGTSEGGIFKTTNGGVTWTKKLSQSANDVKWVTDVQALAIVGTFIYQSTNTGETWTPISNNISTGLLSFVKIDATTFVGVSGGGDIWRSNNSGLTWSLVLDGIGDLPATWHVSFYDNLHGFVVGQSGIMYSSQDGGLTWTMMNSGIGIQIFDMEMYSSTYGLAACHNGYVLRTTNGGVRWETDKVEVTGQIFGRDESLRGVSIVDEGFAVVAGPGGTVFRTYDGGISWESIGYPDLPDPFWISDVEFVSRTHGLVVGTDLDLGHDKTIYRTTDGGTTWILATSQASDMYSVDFVDTQNGWVSTIGSLYFRTTNGGVTWTQSTLPGNPAAPRFSFSSLMNGWAVGWYGYMAKTTNGGASWTVQSAGSGDNLLRVDAVTQSDIWIAGAEPSPSLVGVVHHSTNGGATWSREVLTEFPYTLSAVSALSTGEAWIGGYGGNILTNGSVAAGEPPVVADIPDQTVARGGRFAPLRMDNYVTDADNPDPDIVWSWSGNSVLRVVLDPALRRIRVRAPGTWSGSETIVFTATDPSGLTDSDAATFTVTAAGTEVEQTMGLESDVPEVTSLLGNYPNPFNPTTSISYAINLDGFVSLKVYNSLGEEVAALVNEFQTAGYKSVTWNGRNDAGATVASGLYFYRLTAGNRVLTAKMMFTK